MRDDLPPAAHVVTGSSGTCWLGLSAIRWAIFALVVLTLHRLWFATRLELVPDEAYYWLWSKHLAASYRDKGPAVAWVIALGTWLFGDNVFGIRFFSVLLAMGTGWQLFLLARRLYDDRTALWCLLVAAILPLFAVGSILMTIDSLSVFFWAWATNLCWTALASRKVWHWFALGAVIGAGFLAKFTNGLQIACIGLFLLWCKPYRALLLSRQTFAMCLAFALASAPILVWNIQTGWVHVAALHSRSGVRDSFGIHPLELLRFLGGEAGVLSPLILIGLVIAVLGMLRHHRVEQRVQFLMSQFLPVYGLFLAFSLNKAGKENWPAPALVAGIILLVVFWRELTERVSQWRWAVMAGLGVAGLMTLFLHNADRFDLPGRLEPLRRAQGWGDFAGHVQRARLQYAPTLLIGNHYSKASIMAFYLPDQPRTYVPTEKYGNSQFSLWPPYQVESGTRALFVAGSADRMPEVIQREFTRYELVDDFWSQHCGRPMSRFKIFLCSRD
jgi:4-amino-4-deoxy-L-arabinose transferase-like glycosyltransferase